jgi:hypothetical protein
MKWVSRAATGEAGRIIADTHQRYYNFPDVAESFYLACKERGAIQEQ